MKGEGREGEGAAGSLHGGRAAGGAEAEETREGLCLAGAWEKRTNGDEGRLGEPALPSKPVPILSSAFKEREGGVFVLAKVREASDSLDFSRPLAPCEQAPGGSKGPRQR